MTQQIPSTPSTHGTSAQVPRPRAVSASRLAAADSGTINTTAWNQYLNALLGLPSLQGANLQVAPLAQLADFGNSNSAVANWAIYSMGNQMPQWDVMYRPSETGIFTQFGLFLNGISLPAPTPGGAEQLAADNKALRKAATQLQNDLNANMPAPVISADQALLSSAETTLYADLQSISGPNYAVIGPDLTNWNQAQLGSKPGAVGNSLTMQAQPSSGSSIQEPGYSLVPNDFSAWLTRAQANVQTGTFQQTLALTQSSASSYTGIFSAQSSSAQSIFFGLYSTSSNAWEQLTEQGSGSFSYSVSMSFPGFALYQVVPLGWFDGTLLTDFPNESDFVSTSPFAQSEAFGPSGIFNLMTSEILVVYAPIVTITLDTATYQYVKSQQSSGTCTAISVGPFYNGTAGSSSSGTFTSSNFNDETNTITVSDNSGVPKALAFIPTVLGPAQASAVPLGRR